jgi:SAM-dependent methyltransferase
MSHAKEEQRRAVRERYARVVTEEESCCAPACCSGVEAAAATAAAIGYSERELRHLPEDANLGLGCGNPTALASLEPGQTVLDLGSGAGIDCFLAAKQVGPTGSVIGVDMTPEMIERARANAERGGHGNVQFRLGEIENLPVADASVDVIISNCVLNLSPEKERVLAEAYRVLKPGGRIVVSDMVSEHPVPEIVQGSLDAVAACLPTPRNRYLEDFRAAGFTDVRITEERPYPVDYILADDGVQGFVEAHPEARAELEAFAGSIFGAHFEATKR